MGLDTKLEGEKPMSWLCPSRVVGNQAGAQWPSHLPHGPEQPYNPGLRLLLTHTHPAPASRPAPPQCRFLGNVSKP